MNLVQFLVRSKDNGGELADTEADVVKWKVEILLEISRP